MSEDQTCGCGYGGKYMIGHNACAHLLCYRVRTVSIHSLRPQRGVREKYARVGGCQGASVDGESGPSGWVERGDQWGGGSVAAGWGGVVVDFTPGVGAKYSIGVVWWTGWRVALCNCVHCAVRASRL